MTKRARQCPPPPAIEPGRPIELRVHGDFTEWLQQTGESLAVTTYNSGKLAFFSAANGELIARFWRFPRPMGMASDGRRLALASQHHLWVLKAPRRQAADGLDIVKIYATGRLDAHDLAFGDRGLYFANTRFNCIARPSDRVSFVRSWQPWFVPKRAGRDACHLNGIGVRDGRIELATAFCESGAAGGWREEDRFISGVAIDVQTNRIVCRGLCMPHSPRWRAGRWWLCNSGEGTLCALDETSGDCRPVAELPGFTRGLCFAAGRAVVGLSRIRKKHILDATPVRERAGRLRAGVALVDLATGRVTGSLEFVRGGREVFEVAVLSPHVAG